MSAQRLAALVGAVAGIGALILQFALMFGSMSAQGFSALAIAWRYLGYFTILTNALVAIIWTRAALRPEIEQPRLEGAGAVAIVMVGLLYHLLLASRWNPQGLQLVADFIHHTFVPILFAFYWLIRRHGALKWAHAAIFVIWPLSYCAYALARGAADGWYAYYFLDPTRAPPAQLIASIAAQSSAFLVCAFILVGFDKLIAARSRASSVSAAAPS